jgi:hypothetical protein
LDADIMKHPLKLNRSRLLSNARPAQSKPAHATATADDGLDAPGPDVQVADGTVADVGSPARQAVGVVGKGFQMIAPAFAPEAAGNSAPVEGHGLDVLTFFA